MPPPLRSARLALVLLALALALPAQAQSRFVQACVASAGEDLPPGVDPSRICGCAAGEAQVAGAAPADLDRLVDFLSAEERLDIAEVPEDLRPAAEAAGEAMMGCAMQVGLASMMEAAMGGSAGVAVAAAQGEAVAEGEPVAEAAVTPDGVVASAPSTRAERATPIGFRMGAGQTAIRATQTSKGAAIRILE